MSDSFGVWQRIARVNKKELKVMFKDEALRHCQPGVSVTVIPMP